MIDHNCPRKCTECPEHTHHWMEKSVCEDDQLCDPDGSYSAIIEDWKQWREEDPHGAPFGPIAWVCKHCSAWMRYDETCSECDGPIEPETDQCVYGCDEGCEGPED